MADTTNLSSLLNAHATEIAQLRERISDVIDPSKHDEIWLLRFLLSNKTVDVAETACRFTINWYKTHAAAIETETNKGEPIYYVRGLCNNKGLMDNVSHDDFVNFTIFSRIKALEACAKATKEQNRLVKMVTVVDVQNFNFTRGNDMRFFRAIGDSSKISEKMFPQLLGRSVMANMPPTMLFLFNTVFKPLLSKKTQEKVVLCPGVASGKPLDACPYIARVLKPENIPSFIGGTCNCKGGCISGIPNYQTVPVNAISDSGLMNITVHARSTEMVEVPLAQGAQIKYEFKISEKQDIKVQIVFRPNGGIKEVEVVALRSLEEKDGVISGSFVAPTAGILVKTFDNTFSGSEPKTCGINLSKSKTEKNNCESVDNKEILRTFARTCSCCRIGKVDNLAACRETKLTIWTPRRRSIPGSARAVSIITITLQRPTLNTTSTTVTCVPIVPN
ncbi:hypothetical protein BCR33DRAFT_849125 [Rhizoclosmatium globosum]|uniref:CRAL-TRIO domain-containing protein n=1 Tax=Rhizoclosmatium globosum TaxID=329046 RepID=A0A1Y2CHH7_9FUNG|nr:hypothetical protein BCR33DRAFT_849125 [Rhizoclosmatium globosum]|eukprot:ORY46396.1 hypothetical protein BCR33DRAFT_849125 [Rhizoclosmatium globosum]